MAFNKPNQQRSNSPAIVLRSGALSVSIWKREHEGEVFYNATPSRAYTQDDGKTWEYSDSFNRDELLIVAELMRSAWQWIHRAQKEEAQ